MTVNYQPIQPFHPEPWQKVVMNDTTHGVILLTGSAGGGKSKVAYEKLHAFALSYPGSTIVAARKKREDALKSIVLALENDVIGKDPRVNHNKKAYSFIYENGSRIIYIGMKGEDERKAIRSIGQKGSIDLALMEEATEFEEADFDEFLLRMRGNIAGWNQLMLCTNPDAPLHWINVRLIKGGEAKVYYSSAKDNPHNPETYQDRLDATRGVTRARLRDGLWIAGSGLVIDTWLDDWDEVDRTWKIGNVRDTADYIPDGGPVILCADDGYAGEYDRKTKTFTKKSNPRVFALVQYRGTGQFAVFYTQYQIKTKAGDQLRDLREVCASYGWPFPNTVDYDKAAAHLEGVFKDFGFRYLRKSPANRDESIKLLREVCDKDDNNWRRLIVHPRCHHLRMELSSWSYDMEGRPEVFGDHGIDAIRYFVWNAIRGPGKPVDVAVSKSTPELLSKMDNVRAIYEKHMKAAGELIS